MIEQSLCDSLVYKPLLLDEVSTQDSNKTVLYDCMHVMYAGEVHSPRQDYCIIVYNDKTLI